jgi:hypothetical protein
MKTVDEILDGWFGESLENSENEDQLRKYLYEPLQSLIDEERRKAYLSGHDDGYAQAKDFYNGPPLPLPVNFI